MVARGNGCPLDSKWAAAASWSTSSRWRWVLPAYSSTSAGRRSTTSRINCSSGASAWMLRSMTRLSMFSIDQASSPTTRARTMRPLPLRVWKARRTSVSASRLPVSADHCGRYSLRVSSTSPASSTNTSCRSSSTGSSSAGGGNSWGGASWAGGLIAATGLAITSARVSTTAGSASASAALPSGAATASSGASGGSAGSSASATASGTTSDCSAGTASAAGIDRRAVSSAASKECVSRCSTLGAGAISSSAGTGATTVGLAGSAVTSTSLGTSRIERVGFRP
ncbi:hypothetical protein D3C78_739110 [compost metagenome]